jgi:glycosyltransferase involved in cell wall biosynthesis
MYYLDKNISEAVLTIGNRSDRPDGGIAQVLYSYRRHVFPVFKHVVFFKRGNVVFKIFIAVWGYVQTFFRLLFDRKIKIVHIHTASGKVAFTRTSFFVTLAKSMGKKVAIHIHSGRFNDYYLKNKKQVDKVFSRCDCVVSLTQELKGFYESMGCSKVVIIDNIIEKPVHKEVPKDKYVHFLYFGVITKTKGIYDLVDVIKYHKTEFAGRIILHVGGNKEVDTLLNIIENEDLDEIIKFEGWVSGQKKIDLLNLCDVFILPSYTEGLPISILEALSYGEFIVATNVGGIPEIVDSQNGRLFAPADNNSLYEILTDIMQNHSLILAGKNDRKKKSKRYLPKSVSTQLESMYLKLIK